MRIASIPRVKCYNLRPPCICKSFWESSVVTQNYGKAGRKEGRHIASIWHSGPTCPAGHPERHFYDSGPCEMVWVYGSGLPAPPPPPDDGINL